MELKHKIQIVILLILTSILVLTFIYINPAREVPVIHVDIIFNEKDGIFIAENYTFEQGNVSYIARPKNIMAEKFPAIVARATLTKGNQNIIGPWEAIDFNGVGKYSFNVGFHEGGYPQPGDAIHMSIMVVDKDGVKIGYVIDNFRWR